MKPAEMDQLIDRHIAAEQAGDAVASVAMYTEDIEHDVVGSPTGPARGKAAAQAFYDFLVPNIRTEAMTPVHSYYGDDFCVMEHTWTGTVPRRVPRSARQRSPDHVSHDPRVGVPGRAHQPRKCLARRRGHRRTVDRARSRDDHDLTSPVGN